MRYIYITTLLLFVSKALIAQITVSGTGTSLNAGTGGYGADGTYSVNNAFTFSGLPAFDTGTNQYVNGGLVFSGLYFYRIIRRVNNEWVVAWAYNNSGTIHNGILFKAQSGGTNNDPPCNDLWDEYKYDPNNNTTTGNSVAAVLSGTTCIPLPPQINALVLTPSAQSLPQLTNASISAISNPQPGMMTWSLDDICVKVYDGTTWNCL